MKETKPLPRPRRPAPLNPLRIRLVDFSPAAPTVLDDVTAVVRLFEAEADDVAFNFQWFVDGREIVDAGTDRLDKTCFKKGSWIYCRVQAVSGSTAERMAQKRRHPRGQLAADAAAATRWRISAFPATSATRPRPATPTATG